MCRRFEYRLLMVFYTSCCFSVVAWAQIPSGYYNSAQGLTGSALKTALHNIIDNHTIVSYNSLWNHFEDTDKKSNNKVWDMYSNTPTGTPPYEFTFSSDQCGSYNSENDCYNREHTWPQSWFNSESGPSSDLFHVYPTDGYVNNIRSNYPYGEVDVPSWTSLNGSKLGANSTGGYSQTVFEPIDEYKGDLARSYFYMSTRYQGEDAGWSTSGATNKSTILPWQVDVLLNWHHLDAVSSKELNRNNAVYAIQHNRNPFIDNPQWVDSIWTMTYTTINENALLENTIAIYPNPVTNEFHVSFQSPIADTAMIMVFDVLGNKVESALITHKSLKDYIVNCNTWSNGVYYLKIISGNSFSIKKIVKN
ncbi:MAG: endonuclease [Bacteroidia bacterium]